MTAESIVGVGRGGQERLCPPWIFIHYKLPLMCFSTNAPFSHSRLPNSLTGKRVIFSEKACFLVKEGKHFLKKKKKKCVSFWIHQSVTVDMVMPPPPPQFW